MCVNKLTVKKNWTEDLHSLMFKQHGVCMGILAFCSHFIHKLPQNRRFTQIIEKFLDTRVQNDYL